VRFAPAPTGYLHVGSARTALFNWLFARQTGGTFVLRIEDTDTERSRADVIESIERNLRRLGLDWDEGPYLQSERSSLYADAIERLLTSGAAYRCDCTPDAVKARAEARGGPPGYDGFCRDRDVAPGPGVVARFRTPDEGATSFTDVIRGEVVFEHANLEDFVVQRSNGTPMFLVANAVDDADMGITHVIRGEDLVNVTPKVLLLRRALGIDDVPVFAHLPLLVNAKRQKLSKRRDDVSVEDYERRGILPAAMRNYLCLLGWGPDDGVEVRPIEEIVERFRLEDVSKGSAFFDVQKLEHINGEHIRALSPEAFEAEVAPFLAAGPWPADRFDAGAFSRIAPLVQERIRTLAEAPAMVDFLFLEAPEIDEAAWAKAMRTPGAVAVLDDCLAELADCPWDAATLHDVLARVAERHDLKLAKAQAPVRVAVTGRSVGPPLFEALEVLGREPTLWRLRAARERV
jgi:glutamyl-tRNA synthetase